METNADRSSAPNAVFVYGTLKRGEVREKCWPKRPVEIEAASVRGTIYDFGKYPGLVAGDDVVAGELWRFNAADMPATLAALDKIEGFYSRDDDEYRRVIIDCQTTGEVIKAWTYLYARTSELRETRRIEPNTDGLCRWPTAISDL